MVATGDPSTWDLAFKRAFARACRGGPLVWEHYQSPLVMAVSPKAMSPEEFAAANAAVDVTDTSTAASPDLRWYAGYAAAMAELEALIDTAKVSPPPVPYAEHEAEMMRLLAELDRRHELLDQFATLVSGDAVGEHSSENDPWANALRGREYGPDGLRAEVAAAYSGTVPLLGLATTSELLAEVADRMRTTQNSHAGEALGDMCVEALGNLTKSVLDYRRVARTEPVSRNVPIENPAHQSKAPWTADQVVALEAWQACGWVHPYTCGNDHDGDRRLVATADGWRCLICDYTQDWCWVGMLNGPPPSPFPDGPSPVVIG